MFLLHLLGFEPFWVYFLGVFGVFLVIMAKNRVIMLKYTTTLKNLVTN